MEARLREMIAEAHPHHGITGEEHGEADADREFVWALDPIDGTLIAMLQGGVPVLGVIDMPATAERWVGAAGSPTLRNGEPVRARACDDLSQAMMSTSNIDFYDDHDRPVLERLKAATRLTVYGGSCMAYAQIASGRIDIGLDVAFDVFDYLALVPVIEGAGDIATDWQGAPLTMASGDRFIAAGDPRAHGTALALLAE